MATEQVASAPSKTGPQARTMLSKTDRKRFEYLFRLLFLIVAAVAICSIFLLGELGKRIDQKKSIDLLISDLSQIPVTAANEPKVRSVRHQIVGLQREMSDLISLGTQARSTNLNAIRCRLREISGNAIFYSNDASAAQGSIAAEASKTEPDCTTAVPGTWYIFEFRSETILAILMLLCGLIGAGASLLVGQQGFLRLRRGLVPVLTLGLCSGFIVYLVLKGGRSVFLIDPGLAGDVYSNPYPMALAGALGGLFAKNLYDRLENIVEDALHDDDDEVNKERTSQVSQVDRTGDGEEPADDANKPIVQPAAAPGGG